MKYSFVLPAYKAKFLKQSIDSILSQTYSNFDLIIVNDASPEDLDSIIDTYSDCRIKYYKNPVNIGRDSLVRQWNYSISLTQADYIILASDDDVYDKEYLAKMNRLVDKYPNVHVFRPRVKYIDINGVTTDVGGYLKEFSSGLEVLDAWVKGWIGSGISYYLFKREALTYIGGFADYPLGWFSDDATILRLSENGVVSTTDVLFSFRVSDLSISGRKNSATSLKSKILATKMFYDEVHEYLTQVNCADTYSIEIRNSVKKWFPSFMQTTKLFTELLNASFLNVTKQLFIISRLKFVSKKSLWRMYLRTLFR